MTRSRKSPTAANLRMATRNTEIKRLKNEKGMSIKDIAEKFGLKPLRVSEILHTPWSHLMPNPPEPTETRPSRTKAAAERAATMKHMRMVEGKTLDEIAQTFKVTRERVRQIVGNPKSHLLREPKAKAETKPQGRPRGKREVVPEAPHGTLAGYNRFGCGCDECYGAYKADYEKRRASKGDIATEVTEVADAS